MSDHLEEIRWEQTTELCVVCPTCGFTFDSAHTDADGGYSCPVCSETAVADAELDAAEARLAACEQERDAATANRRGFNYNRLARAEEVLRRWREEVECNSEAGAPDYVHAYFAGESE